MERCIDCETKKLHFIKALIGDFRHRLWLPPAVVESIVVDEYSANAILKNRGGRIWKVELRKVAGRLLFKKGWSKFVQDNQLEDGNFLVFKYDGDLHFTLIMLDNSFCEKEEHIIPAAGTSRPICKNDHLTSGGSTDASETSTEKSDRSSTDAPKSKKRKLSKRSSVKRQQYKVVSQRRVVTDQERQRVIDAAKAFHSHHPYCRILMKKYHVNSFFFVNIPASFRNQHLPFEKAELTLLDPHGRSWPVGYVSLNPKTRGLCKGWLRFLKGNNIEEGDVCVFELIKPKTLRVHIIRVVDELVPPLTGRTFKD